MAHVYLLDAMMIGKLADSRPDPEVDATTRRFREHLHAIGDAKVIICAITVGEAEFGLRIVSGMDDGKREAVRRTLTAFSEVFSIDRATAILFGEVRAALFDKHAPLVSRNARRKIKWVEDLVDRTSAKSLGVQENDVWLAAVALQYNLVLVSDDRMTRIKEAWPKLHFVNWLE